MPMPLSEAQKPIDFRIATGKLEIIQKYPDSFETVWKI